MHGSRYNLLGCKIIVRHAYEYVACSNAQQRLMPPFRSDLQMPLSRVQKMNALPMNLNLRNPLYVEFNMYSIS